MRVPSVSIGLAVRNGADFLREAMDFLLSQDHCDFELKDAAYQKSLEGLSVSQRLQHRRHRTLDRHLMWRFGPKA